MADSEIMAMVPADKLADIKAKDGSPLIKAFVVGHEGEARGNLIGMGNVVKRWFRSAIEKLHEKIKGGLQLFHGHAATNDTAGRTPIGEVVGKKLMNVEDQLSTVVACWIYPDFRHLPLDVASIEADIDLRGDNTNSLYVADVGEISGIALGNSQIDTPGFPGATLLGQLQAFAQEKNYLDPAQNPFIRLSGDEIPGPIDPEKRRLEELEREEERMKYLDPGQNPLIRKADE
jgi:hypothetical protein